MGIILTIVASPEKLHERFMRFCMAIKSRLAIRVTQIWIFIALAKYLRGKICFSCLKRSSISYLLRYMAIISSEGMSISLVSSDINWGFFFLRSTYVTILVLCLISPVSFVCKLNDLYSFLHKSIRSYVHYVWERIIDKILLYLCNIYHTSTCHFLEFGVVYICPV